MTHPQEREVVIVGAGIAGASLAHFLAEAGVKDVLLVEREARPAHHASGRSAEALVEVDPDPLWQHLLLEGHAFLRQPPPSIARAPLCRATGVMNLLEDFERDALEAGLTDLRRLGVVADIVEPAIARDIFPWLSARDFAGALYLPRSGRVSADALMGGFLGSARSRGAELWLSTEVTAVDTSSGRVSAVHTTRGEVRCRTLVCAAGAWAPDVARMAGALPVPLTALRRTVVSFDPPPGVEVAGWPLVSFDSRGIYLASEGAGIIASPMDQDPVAACDAMPSPDRVALALERLDQLAAPLVPQGLRAARAGLRTFAPDRRLVLGEDPVRAGFFWLAGQGGNGIETSPAVGRLAAELLTRGAIADAALAAAVSPARFAARTT